MKMRYVALAMAAALAGCAQPGATTNEPATPPKVEHSARAEPSIGAATKIDTDQALAFALEQAGITDVHPVKSADGGVAAWATVPKFKKCPIYLRAVNNEAYSVSHIRMPDGTIKPMDMEGYAISPTAADLASWAANNMLTITGCFGGQAPAANDWPTGPPPAK